ncbi:hypothetical protein [Shouchella patagoniensis]|uniref:hypothetical protein n=1 Tax=Shouchella patagoniensis TaxID=228576 RepID=UPI000994C4FA|nr:hypothetical protein [Shouchella patagoniensis]
MFRFLQANAGKGTGTKRFEEKAPRLEPRLINGRALNQGHKQTFIGWWQKRCRRICDRKATLNSSNEGD